MRDFTMGLDCGWRRRNRERQLRVGYDHATRLFRMVRHRTPGRTRQATGRGRTARRPQGRLRASLQVLPRPSTPSPNCASTAMPGTPQYNATDTGAAHTVAVIRRPCFARGRRAARSSLRPISAMTARPRDATTSGVFSRQTTAEASPVLDPPQAPGFQAAGDIPGLIHEPDFVAEEEEAKLLAWLDGAEWSTELRRRVQHYGWRYDYRKRRIDKSMRIGGFPPWAQELAQRLVAKGLVGELPDQLIVNEYCGNQGISPHIDQPASFAEHVSTVSLLETWGMVLRHRKSGKKVEIPLERRSVAVLAGAVRYKWTHEIPSRKTELLVDQQGKRRRVPRSRRISLTFRVARQR